MIQHSLNFLFFREKLISEVRFFSRLSHAGETYKLNQLSVAFASKTVDHTNTDPDIWTHCKLGFVLSR